MARVRTGARSYLDVIAKACKLSHIPGFSGGLIAILGETDAGDILTLWGPFCTLVEFLIANDDFFNKIDATTPNRPDSEDSVPL